MSSYAWIAAHKKKEARKNIRDARKRGESIDFGKTMSAAVSSAKKEWHAQPGKTKTEKDSHRGGGSSSSNSSNERKSAAMQETNSINDENRRRTLIGYGRAFADSTSNFVKQTSQSLATGMRQNQFGYTPNEIRKMKRNIVNQKDLPARDRITALRTLAQVARGEKPKSDIQPWGELQPIVDYAQKRTEAEQRKPLGQRVVEGLRRAADPTGMGKAVFQGIARSGAKAVSTFAEPFVGKENATFKPEGVAKYILGEKRIKPLTTIAEEQMKKAAPYGKLAQGGAALLPVALVAGDIIPSFGAKNVAKEVVEALTPRAAMSVAKKLGLKATDDVLKRIINIKTADQATDFVNRVKSIAELRKAKSGVDLAKADEFFKKTPTQEKLLPKIKSQAENLSSQIPSDSISSVKITNSKIPKGTEQKILPKESQLLQARADEKVLQMDESGIQSTLKKGKIIDKTQLAKPSNLIKGDVSKFYNVDRMKIGEPAKQAITKEIDNAGKQLEKTVGKTLTNKEVIDKADMTARTLDRVVGREQTAQQIAANLNLRRKIAQVADSGKIDQEFVDLWIKDKAAGENIARQLQARKIIAKPEEADHINTILESIYKVNKDADAILKEAKKVDFNDYKQVTEFYRKFVKPSAGEWLDKLRYNSMLSSPNTHLVNTASNFEGTGIIAPIEKTITGTLDAMRSALTGSERKYYAKEGYEYAKGYYSNVAKGAKKFIGVMRGEVMSGNPDVRNIPLATGGVKRVVEKVLDYPMRLLEGMDQFFTAMTAGGVEKSLAYRASKGVEVGNIKGEAFTEATKRLFRASKDEQQGVLLDSIDKVTNTIMQLRKSDNAITRTISKFTLPFVRTPMNLLKQGIEYSPVGLLTLPGATNKTEQLSKVIIGMASAGAAATLLGQDRLTWAEPTDAKAKAAFRAAGRQPYSLKIGDKWINYSKLHPAVAFNLALVSSIDDSTNSKKLDESTGDAILNAFAKYGNFLVDQSYAKNMGDFLAASKGDAERWTSYFSNYPQQLIPFRALQGWITRLIDPNQRKIDVDGTMLEKQMQQVMTNIPGLSKYVPARLDKDGNPIPNQNQMINAFSPNRITTERPGYKEQFQELIDKRQSDRDHQQLLDKAKDEVLKTGQSQTIGDTIVYRENGEIKTTQSETIVESKKLYDDWKGLSDSDFNKRVEEFKKDKGDKEVNIAQQVEKYRKNDVAKELGLQFEGDWTRPDLNINDKGNVIMQKMDTLSPDDKARFFAELVDRNVASDDLVGELVKRKVITGDQVMTQNVSAGVKAAVVYNEIKDEAGGDIEKMKEILGGREESFIKAIASQIGSAREKKAQYETFVTEIKARAKDDKARGEGLIQDDTRWSKMTVEDRTKILLEKTSGKPKSETIEYLNGLEKKGLITEDLAQEYKYQYKKVLQDAVEAKEKELSMPTMEEFQQMAPGSPERAEATAKAEEMLAYTEQLQGADVVTASAGYPQLQGRMRTDRNNNPIAAAVGAGGSNQFTKALDSAGIKWSVGDAFPGDPNMHTIRIEGDPVQGAKAILENSNAIQGWYANHTGKDVLPAYGVKNNEDFKALSEEDKIAVVAGIYASEGGEGDLKNTKYAQAPLSPEERKVVQAVGTGKMAPQEATKLIVDHYMAVAQSGQPPVPTQVVETPTTPEPTRTAMWLATMSNKVPAWNMYMLILRMRNLGSLYQPQETAPAENPYRLTQTI